VCGNDSPQSRSNGRCSRFADVSSAFMLLDVCLEEHACCDTKLLPSQHKCEPSLILRGGHSVADIPIPFGCCHFIRLLTFPFHSVADIFHSSRLLTFPIPFTLFWHSATQGRSVAVPCMVHCNTTLTMNAVHQSCTLSHQHRPCNCAQYGASFLDQDFALEECHWDSHSGSVIGIHDVLGLKPSQHVCDVISAVAEFMVDVVGVNASMREIQYHTSLSVHSL
jgi:hypothetical protein